MCRFAGLGGSAAQSVLPALLLCAVVMSAPAAQAATVIRVPDDFATIQAAVNAAAADDVIQVAAGTYCEHVVISTSRIRLQAATGAILSGDCADVAGLGYGFAVQGTAAAPVTGVEISGFIVERFETGIGLIYANNSTLRDNEVRFNAWTSCTGINSNNCSHAIILQSSSFNQISGNFAHHNGHLGVGLRAGSNGNLVLSNRLLNNQTDGDSCSLMVWGTPANTGNEILDNDVVDSSGRGIMIGPGPSANNVIALNRVHGHPGAGVIAMGPAATPAHDNLFLQNDAHGNATDASWLDFDLVDLFGTNNIWLRNLGTCAAGSGICAGK